MGIIVCKFGGTSTASADMFRQIMRIIDMNGDRRYIVLSAPGSDGGEKVTDTLCRCHRLKVAGADPSPAIDAVAGRFEGIARSLGIRGFGAVARREVENAKSYDHLVSRGEYLCARLFSMYSGIPFEDAAACVVFDPKGRLDEGETLRRFKALGASMPRAVIPGFYGARADGAIVAFPRNGSDITGALAASGVGASLYENWSDMPGLMTADPSIDPDARLIPEITFADMRRLAQAGARVLHPDCLAPVERAGIPLRLKCTLQPDTPGTLVKG